MKHSDYSEHLSRPRPRPHYPAPPLTVVNGLFGLLDLTVVGRLSEDAHGTRTIGVQSDQYLLHRIEGHRLTRLMRRHAIFVYRVSLNC